MFADPSESSGRGGILNFDAVQEPEEIAAGWWIRERDY